MTIITINNKTRVPEYLVVKCAMKLLEKGEVMPNITKHEFRVSGLGDTVLKIKRKKIEDKTKKGRIKKDGVVKYVFTATLRGGEE